MEETVRELKDGEKGKVYLRDTNTYFTTEKTHYNKITVDSRGFTHSLDSNPSHINYLKNGYIFFKYYYNHGKRENLNGPAFIKYSKSGKIIKESYYIQGVKLTKDEWKLRINRIQMLNEF